MSQLELGTRIHQSTLLSRRQVAEGTLEFRFAKPAGFAFKPGQAIDLVLPQRGAGEELRHAFSLVSAPFEDELAIATRMRESAYKRALGSLPPGAAVAFEGPSGSLTLHKDRGRAAVLIAGGIGITPFISMLRQAGHDRVPRPLALLYSNRRPEDAAYLDELTSLARENQSLRLVATMTDTASSSRPWHAETRMIDASLIAEAASALPAPIYYVVGPPGMVDAVRRALAGAGIDDDDIRSEEFYGY